MKVNAVNFNINNPNFRANNFNSVPNSLNSDSRKKLRLGLSALALLGTASLGYAVLKKHNPQAVKQLKNSFSDFKNLLKNKPAVDSITKQLNGKRNIEGVKIYKACKAQEKLSSMHNKLLNGYFDGKPAKVFEHLRKNEQLLQQQAKFAI